MNVLLKHGALNQGIFLQKLLCFGVDGVNVFRGKK
jgi:hypothetical protein